MKRVPLRPDLSNRAVKVFLILLAILLTALMWSGLSPLELFQALFNRN